MYLRGVVTVHCIHSIPMYLENQWGACLHYPSSCIATYPSRTLWFARNADDVLTFVGTIALDSNSDQRILPLLLSFVVRQFLGMQEVWICSLASLL
jgi:hypothetical protein